MIDHDLHDQAQNLPQAIMYDHVNPVRKMLFDRINMISHDMNSQGPNLPQTIIYDHAGVCQSRPGVDKSCRNGAVE